MLLDLRLALASDADPAMASGGLLLDLIPRSSDPGPPPPPSSSTTTAPLIVPQAAPARLRDTIPVSAASYTLIVAETVTSTWPTATTATASIIAESVSVAARTTSHTRTASTGRAHTSERLLTRTSTVSPWDSRLETDDELFLLLD